MNSLEGDVVLAVPHRLNNTLKVSYNNTITNLGGDLVTRQQHRLN